MAAARGQSSWRAGRQRAAAGSYQRCASRLTICRYSLRGSTGLCSRARRRRGLRRRRAGSVAGDQQRRNRALGLQADLLDRFGAGAMLAQAEIALMIRSGGLAGQDQGAFDGRRRSGS